PLAIIPTTATWSIYVYLNQKTTNKMATLLEIRRVLLRSAKAISATCSISLSSARAGPRGERLPCSQLRTVSSGTPMRAANSACEIGRASCREMVDIYVVGVLVLLNHEQYLPTYLILSSSR